MLGGGKKGETRGKTEKKTEAYIKYEKAHFKRSRTSGRGKNGGNIHPAAVKTSLVQIFRVILNFSDGNTGNWSWIYDLKQSSLQLGN